MLGSKFGSCIFCMNSFNGSVILDLPSQLIKHCRDRLHNAAPVSFQLFNGLREAFSHSIDGLHSLNWERSSAIFKNVQFFELGGVTEHVLSHIESTLISPMEEAIPAP